MGYAFISYDNTDREFTIRLAEDLQAAGCAVWIDKWNVVGRDPFWDEIQVGIENCTHFVFVITPHSLDRNSGAFTELLHAASLKPRPTIVPVMPIATPFKALPLVISPGQYQIHDFTRGPYPDMLRRVIAALSPDARPKIAAFIKSMEAEQGGKGKGVHKPRRTVLDDSLTWIFASRRRFSALFALFLGALLVLALLISSKAPVPSIAFAPSATNSPRAEPTVLANAIPTSTLSPMVVASVRADVFLRAGPGMSYRVIGTSRTGAQLPVMGRTREGWLLVKVESGALAWVWIDFVDLQPPNALLPTITVTP